MQQNNEMYVLYLIEEPLTVLVINTEWGAHAVGATPGEVARDQLMFIWKSVLWRRTVEDSQCYLGGKYSDCTIIKSEERLLARLVYLSDN